jgi:alkylation response protein AidB-like acyl-CoA dehydrogenase
LHARLVRFPPRAATSPSTTRRRRVRQTHREHGRWLHAPTEMDLHVARLATLHCAWVLDQGKLARHESSRAKVIVSEATWRIADRCVQVLGGQGVTDETIVARIFADLRAFRIYDGPSEVHRWSIAKRILKGKVN